MTDQPFRAHVLVCTQQKADKLPSCPAVGAGAVLEAFEAEIGRVGLAGEVLVTPCGCLGLCERGPNVILYPGGRWLVGVGPEDVTAIVRDHIVEDRPPPARLCPDPAAIRIEVAAHEARIEAALAARARAGVLPEELEALFRGYQPARVALTAVELDLFSAVGSGATAAEVAASTGASLRGVEPLLNALVALGLLHKDGDRFSCGSSAGTFLRAGAPHDARGALMHTANLWTRWSTLTEAVRQGTSVGHVEIAERGQEWTEAFIAAMHRNASARAPVVIAALDLTGVRRILDLGGGSGAYAAAFSRAQPQARVTVFDLPTVTPLTRKYLDLSGVGDRVDTVDGDLRVDPLGEGWDLVFISAICHINGPDENVAMLEKVRAALRPGGSVVIQDFVLGADKTSPRAGALFALNMLVGTEGGGAYSAEEYVEWLARVGFREARTIALPGPTDLVTALAPG